MITQEGLRDIKNKSACCAIDDGAASIGTHIGWRSESTVAAQYSASQHHLFVNWAGILVCAGTSSSGPSGARMHHGKEFFVILNRLLQYITATQRHHARI